MKKICPVTSLLTSQKCSKVLTLKLSLLFEVTFFQQSLRVDIYCFITSSSIEINLIVYFKDLQSRLKPSALWSVWSMLRRTLSPMTVFQNLKSFLSLNSKGYNPKNLLSWSGLRLRVFWKVLLISNICLKKFVFIVSAHIYHSSVMHFLN